MKFSKAKKKKRQKLFCLQGDHIFYYNGIIYQYAIFPHTTVIGGLAKMKKHNTRKHPEFYETVRWLYHEMALPQITDPIQVFFAKLNIICHLALILLFVFLFPTTKSKDSENSIWKLWCSAHEKWGISQDPNNGLHCVFEDCLDAVKSAFKQERSTLKNIM